MAEVFPISRLTSGTSLRIGDLARRVGKSTRALRLYEDLGLLGPTERTEGGHRLYGEDALLRLGWIERLQVLGLSLQEIKAFLDALDDEGTGPAAMAKVRGMFASKLAEVRGQIAALQTLSEELESGLAYLETCHTCAPSTELGACRACDQDHSTEPPLLITGIHKRQGEGK